MGGADTEIRLGLVGCGRLAERGYLPAIRGLSGVRLAAVADPVLSRCRDLAPEAAAHDGAGALVAAGGVDAVVIATPASSHLADATAAAGAGLPALVEKPPAPDAEEAAAMAALDPAPWIGFNRRFEKGLQRLRSSIPAAGELDVLIETHHPGGSWGSHVVHDDALLAHGPHALDLLRWLTGSEIERVRAAEIASDHATLELGLGRGRARISCGAAGDASDLVIVRAGGEALAYRGHGALRRVWRRLRRPGRAGALVHLLSRELEEFIAAARGGRPRFLASAADGLAVMAAIDGARSSFGSGASWRPSQPVPAGR